MSTPQSNDEIDLMELLVKSVLIVKRNLLQIVLFFVMGTVIGFAYAMLADKTYESKMLISSDILTESFAAKLSENIETLIDEKNYIEISKKLSIDPSEAKDFSKIEIESLKDKTLPEEDDNNYFLVKIEVENEALLSKLQMGIIHYLENNEFVSIRVEQRKDYLKQVLTRIDIEIKSLEEFKTKIIQVIFYK
ncbi:MAG: hypothetical protein HC811_13480 [Flammeovirgaceae bacterium]|nr:hypothetical protein [Flammeovirgaceae bacterium]